MGILDGKVAIVTGAARGLGREYAKVLGGAGAKVVVADLNDCSETVAETGRGAIGVKVDIGDMASVQAMADRAVEAFGRIDILVNNAALFAGLKGGKFDTIDPDEWDRTMRINVKGSWHCCKAVVPTMRKVGGGSIVNVASAAALYGMPLFLHYAASKGAVIAMTRSLARELGRDNIRVNAIAPSAVTTEGAKEFFGDRLDHSMGVIAGSQVIKRNLAPSDVSGTVLWLASDQAAFITGQTIAVDGGTVFL